MKKTIALILLFSLIIPLATGCMKTGEPRPGEDRPKAQPVATTVTIPTATAASEYTGDADIVGSSPQAELQIPDPFPGNVTYEVGDQAAAELTVDANAAQDQRISLTTSDGIVWTLTIPPGAVSETVKIKMSELKNIRSSDLGSLQTGVLLEPDGLEFALPVALSMTGEQLGSLPVLLRGSHDGSELNFTQIAAVENGVTVSLTHFSTAYGDPGKNNETLDKVKEAARQNYQAVRKMAIGFLKEKITTPQPPAIPLRCTADEKVKQDRENQVQIFLAEFAAPEENIARYVLEAGSSDAFYNDQNDSIELAAKILGRLVKKAVALIQAYYPQEEYYVPVMRAAISADRQYQLLGGSEEGQNVLEKAAEWARKIADKYLKALREQHDYQLITTLVGMDREASLLGKSRENIFGELKKALKFKVQFDLQATTDVEYDHVSWTTQGKADYSYFDSGAPDYRSIGKGAYTGFQWPVPEDLPPVIMTSPPNFDFEVVVQNFDACETNSFDLLINRFAADVETYASGGMELPYASGNGFVSAIMWAAFEDKITEPPEGREGYPWYRFTIPLQNLNEVAGEMSMPREAENVTANLKIMLIHAPEK